MLVIGCASAPVTTDARSSNPSTITAQELQASAARSSSADVLTVLRDLRPGWFSVGSNETLTIYLGRQRLVDFAVLGSVRATQVKSVQRYRSALAPAEYPGAGVGWVIVVETR
jgi:hypothetical protein